jgi:hypothetical protein
MGKFAKAIDAFKTSQTVIVCGRNTIKKIDKFLQNTLKVSYSTEPKNGGIEFKLFYPLSIDKHYLI